MDKLKPQLEHSCFEALDLGLTGDDIVDYIVNENVVFYHQLGVGDQTRKGLEVLATKIYKEISDTFLYGI
tara:strand:+ start:13614 stop:13823 length:210 start_codon:yes stop_codon:yes gene_type:complete